MSNEQKLRELKDRREYIMRSISYTAGRAGREGTSETEHYMKTMREVLRQVQELDTQIAKLEGK